MNRTSTTVRNDGELRRTSIADNRVRPLAVERRTADNTESRRL